MIVEVRGANTRNKGAELMLRAIVRELEGKHRVAVESRVGSYDERARMGLLQKVSGRLPEPVMRTAGRLLPSKERRHLLDKYGLLFDDRVEAILDASGFAYTDQFDLSRCEVAAGRAERARRSGKPYVLLPQAFGPFTSPERRAAFVRLADSSDLLYARERISLEHVLESGCRTDHVRLAPDFTCLLDGEVPPEFEPPDRLALIVPSEKLLSATSSEVQAAYLPFLAAAAAWLRDNGFDVRILLHERNDAETVEGLRALLATRVPLVRFENAVHLKGIIGSAQLVVGSRFHALVSALSQGVPSVGVGWSHKYEMLFEGYGCPERVLDPRAGASALAEHLSDLSEGPERARLVRGLRTAAAVQVERARSMWSEVHALLAAGEDHRAREPGRLQRDSVTAIVAGRSRSA
jgi:colanic acid/amylovoran biosynthesis protein